MGKICLKDAMAHQTQINTKTVVVVLNAQKHGRSEQLKEKKTIRKEDKAADLQAEEEPTWATHSPNKT